MEALTPPPSPKVAVQPALSPLQNQLIAALELRGLHARWIRIRDEPAVRVKPMHSAAAATVTIRFESPADLRGWRVVCWRHGTMEELTVARPTIWQLCYLTKDASTLEHYRAFWRATSSSDWDGNPGVTSKLPDWPTE